MRGAVDKSVIEYAANRVGCLTRRLTAIILHAEQGWIVILLVKVFKTGRESIWVLVGKFKDVNILLKLARKKRALERMSLWAANSFPPA